LPDEEQEHINTLAALIWPMLAKVRTFWYQEGVLGRPGIAGI
jgi:hypothetical protein